MILYDRLPFHAARSSWMQRARHNLGVRKNSAMGSTQSDYVTIDNVRLPRGQIDDFEGESKGEYLLFVKRNG